MIAKLVWEKEQERSKKNCIVHKNAIIKWRYITLVSSANKNPSSSSQYMSNKCDWLQIMFFCIPRAIDKMLFRIRSREMCLLYVRRSNRIVLFYLLCELRVWVFVCPWNKLYWHRIDVDFQFYTFLTRSCASVMDKVPYVLWRKWIC